MNCSIWPMNGTLTPPPHSNPTPLLTDMSFTHVRVVHAHARATVCLRLETSERTSVQPPLPPSTPLYCSSSSSGWDRGQIRKRTTTGGDGGGCKSDWAVMTHVHQETTRQMDTHTHDWVSESSEREARGEENSFTQRALACCITNTWLFTWVWKKSWDDLKKWKKELKLLFQPL